jgi:hypothetical protein
MRAVRSFVRSVRAAATKDIQTAFTGLIAAEAAAERERTVWISRPHTRGQITVLFSQITSVSSTSEYKIQDSCSFSGALNVAPTRKALITNSISNVTNNVRNIPCIQTALFIAPLLNHIRVAHLLSVWCIHGGESAWKKGSSDHGGHAGFRLQLLRNLSKYYSLHAQDTKYIYIWNHQFSP